MKYDLPVLAKRNGLRRNVTFRAIEPTQSHAKELASLYLAVVKAWQRNSSGIMAGYTVPTLDSLTIDAPSDHASAIAATESEVSRLILAFTTALAAFGARIERWHRAKWASAVRAATGIDVSTVLTAFTADETLEAFIERNVALIRDISDQARGRISDAVYRAYQNRTPTRALAREIADATDMARKRAVSVAADQAGKLSGMLDEKRMAEAGIALWKFRHSGKLHFREEHRARNNQIYTLGSNRQVKPDGTPMPGGGAIPNGRGPSELPWCGCRRAAYLPIEATLE